MEIKKYVCQPICLMCVDLDSTHCSFQIMMPVLAPLPLLGSLTHDTDIVQRHMAVLSNQQFRNLSLQLLQQ